MEAKTVEPAFVVLQCSANVGPVERFGIGCVGRGLQTSVDERAFGLCEERGSGGIVVDEKISEESDYYSKESLLYSCQYNLHHEDDEISYNNENPPPPLQSPDPIHEPNSIGQDTPKSTG